MNSIPTDILTIAHVLLDNEKNISKDKIIEVIERAVSISTGYVDKDLLLQKLEEDFSVKERESSFLVNDEVKPWLMGKKSSYEFELTKRFFLHLKKTSPYLKINSIDGVTDKILDKCIDPSTLGAWDRRGMVVGNVQSGKTVNYTTLINKATDVGYRVIIVIAGIHNSLRAQTQRRIDEGYVGNDSSSLLKNKKSKNIGVGNTSAKTKIYSYTSSEHNGDFKKSFAEKLNVPIGGAHPTILVIKKNKSILENLISWFAGFARENSEGDLKIFDAPMLLIDDEADNASVNTGKDQEIKTINGLIRTLLNLFNQNSFIGYTATPYANLFIGSEYDKDYSTQIKGYNLKVGEDLFPRDFIVNIPPPTNYIGASEYFGFSDSITGENVEGMDLIRSITDQEPYFPKKYTRETKNNLPDGVPDSLKEAIKSFILSCSVRILRGDAKKDNSMLIHVALLINWIDRIALLVDEVLYDYKNQISSNDGPLIEELKQLYEQDYLPTTDNVSSVLNYKDHKIVRHSWDEVKKHLHEAVSKIEVRAIHGQPKRRGLEYTNTTSLNYEDYKDQGLSVIAVGGNRLSRGITLEGLSVSYFLRTSPLYDTLLQMGRWFGYRPGYADLCRVYTTEELCNWYMHIALATEEMRRDIDTMGSMNKQPKDYKLKVRTHQGMLNITSAGKLGFSEKEHVGFSGAHIQTYELPKKYTDTNLIVFQNLINVLGKPKIEYVKGKINRMIFRDVCPSIVVDFITEYQSDIPAISMNSISTYISTQNKGNKLTKWTIVLRFSSVSDPECLSVGGELYSVGLPQRSYAEEMSHERLLTYRLKSNNISGTEDRVVDLNLKGKETTAEIKKVREIEESSLLTIFPMRMKHPDKDKEELKNEIVVGWDILLPNIPNEEKVEYQVRPLSDAYEGQEDDDIDECDD
ncbi:Z1 domain-containing protein [Halosquirtibacter xylanolyticus]|uniref:Z1 domain-containing protein n=1 Tax=Halosquirtibacter xylanolyticus TaxID=3374599 RepID=UPI00374808E1|nr:Z1 domain-containing protein [Prolixibacteraceae bacterium]